MRQINAHVESEGVQLESLLRAQSREKCAVVFGTPAARSPAVAKECGRRTGLWSVELSLQLGIIAEHLKKDGCRRRRALTIVAACTHTLV